MKLTLAQIAAMVHGELRGDADAVITGAAPLKEACSGQIAFAEPGPHLQYVGQSSAGAVIVPRQAPEAEANLILSDNPRAAFAKVLIALYPPSRPKTGLHQTAVVGANCILGDDVSVAAGVVIGDHVTLGRGVVLYPNVVVGDHVTIGEETVIYPQVSILDRCIVGKRCIIHAGAVIGSDGFGFVPDQSGRYTKIPQVGIVQIDDDVEIGAGTTIDRATLGKTWIQSRVKTDNLVHIAHNVTIGEDSIIVAQVGISGSVTIGRRVILAGQVGVGGHLTIGDDVKVGGRAGVAHSLPDKQVVSGTITAMPHATWLRLNRELPNLPELFKQVRSLEKRLKCLEEKGIDPSQTTT